MSRSSSKRNTSINASFCLFILICHNLESFLSRSSFTDSIDYSFINPLIHPLTRVQKQDVDQPIGVLLVSVFMNKKIDDEKRRKRSNCKNDNSVNQSSFFLSFLGHCPACCHPSIPPTFIHLPFHILPSSSYRVDGELSAAVCVVVFKARKNCNFSLTGTIKFSKTIFFCQSSYSSGSIFTSSSSACPASSLLSPLPPLLPVDAPLDAVSL